MKSTIQSVTSRYTKLENILPDELNHSTIIEELEEAKKKINEIIEEDLRNVKSLSSSHNRNSIQRVFETAFDNQSSILHKRR
jgi:hypothetical protein